VLVLSTDALAAALLGALIETEGHQVHFADAGEGSRGALRRVRPAVVFIDCAPRDGCSPDAIGPAKMLGASLVLFGGPDRAEWVRDCARTHDAYPLVLPARPGELRDLLAETVKAR